MQLRFTRSRSVTKYRLMQERFEPTTTQFRLVDAANRTDPSDGEGINSTSTYLNFCHNLSPSSLLFLFANILSCLCYCFLRFTARISEIEARWRYHKFDLTYYKRLEELCYGTDLLEIWKTFFYRERKTELFTQIVVFYYKKLDRF